MVASQLEACVHAEGRKFQHTLKIKLHNHINKDSTSPADML